MLWVDKLISRGIALVWCSGHYKGLLSSGLKVAGRGADGWSMGGFSDMGWLLVVPVVAFGMLYVLKAMAIYLRNETMIHDLRKRVAELQIEQFHLQMLRHGVVPQSRPPVDAGSAPEAGVADSIGEATSPDAAREAA